MKMLKILMVVAVSLGAPLGVSASVSARDVDVQFSSRIEEDMKRIDRIELRREKFFRTYRVEGANRRPVGNLNVNRFRETEFANERLIPDVEDFSFKTLVAAMAEYDLQQVKDRNPDHKLVVEIEDFWVSNYSLNRFNSFTTRMVGTLSLVDASGAVVKTQEVDTVIVPQFTQSWNYTGSEYAYLDQSASVRVSPILATFLKKGIEGLYPGADIPGPIFVRQ